uniref:Orc1-like AAA ATPase domain-containing protein n=2 Tax=Odontella aurita TaxID=265563 RepID=A0A7S4HNX1_9STRA|mmetsp:Transcript_12951/g.37993  ORF Transcript_12951/g.37993 Transcript_12951/m.37993 type:complete len:596 (+) Transcript_12951:174-1961(+)
MPPLVGVQVPCKRDRACRNNSFIASDAPYTNEAFDVGCPVFGSKATAARSMQVIGDALASAEGMTEGSKALCNARIEHSQVMAPREGLSNKRGSLNLQVEPASMVHSTQHVSEGKGAHGVPDEFDRGDLSLQYDLNEIFHQQAKSVDIGDCSKPLSTLPSHEKWLEMIRLAQGCVMVASQIREFSSITFPVHPSCEGQVTMAGAGSGNSLVSTKSRQESTDEIKGGDDDLTQLGTQLYELFSGWSVERDGIGEERIATSSGAAHAQTDAEIAEDIFSPIARRRRRGKQVGASLTVQGCVSLSELGLPPVICSLVSSIIDSDGTYETIEDVEEDLRRMVSQPDEYLSPKAAEVACTNGQFRIALGTLYGREEEIKKLKEIYNRATNADIFRRTKEIVLISGSSGTGKSALVWNMQDHFVKKGACFVSGKFDAMCQAQPLSAFVSAVDDYCGFLADNGDRISTVQEALNSAISSQGRAMLPSLIPNLVKILGPVPGEDYVPSMRSNGPEALQRLLFMIRALFQATCSCANPVVLFLDDLQWADEISLVLMRALLSDIAIQGLMFIGSYRNNEVGKHHILMNHLADSRYQWREFTFVR